MRTTARAVTVGAALSAVLALAGCTGGKPAAAPPASPPSAVASAPAAPRLPDPMDSAVPLGAKVLYHGTGAGSAALDLRGMPRSATALKVTWSCAGPGRMTFESDGKVHVGGSCDAAGNSNVFGGEVPRANFTSLDWKVTADPKTAWRIAVISLG
ncbi:hypothetical protein ACIQGZ_25815 [Streptomyces sp. NPDC092296]|uniref:hypothetical protein n=1 Tax=Streptomyces sp. NPDC092296 TaxID=3366012 RepID=UPI0037F9A1DC